MCRVQCNWSGKYPCLCDGQWILIVDCIDVSNKIPDDLRRTHMNTYGIYEEWYFDNDREKWGEYVDGLKEFDWIIANGDWLNDITTEMSLHHEIYKAINEKDWRYNQCGGCI